MNLLFLVHRIPYPPNKGDKIRSFHELRYLAARHRVHVGCLVDQPEDLAHVAALRQLAAGVEAVPLDARRARLRSLTALATGEPLSVRYFASRALRRWVRATVERERIDAVLLFSSPMFEYVRDLNVPVVMDFCDVDSDKWRQYVEHAPLVMRPVYALEARRLRAYEETVLRACRSAVLVAERERQMWSGMPDGLLDKVRVIPNGVDLEFFAPHAGPAVAREPHAIVFTGAMDYYANVDGVTYFADEVLPRIRAAVPDVRFYIVGSRPTPDVVALGQRPGITVTGFVDDIRSYYARAAVCVVPLRIARGIQNKLLEALAMGRPVVATHAAAEGLEPGAETALRVAGDAAAMANECTALLQAPAAAESLGRDGRRYVEQAYLWDRALAGLEALLEEAAGSRGRAADAAVPAAAERVPTTV